MVNFGHIFSGFPAPQNSGLIEIQLHLLDWDRA